MGPSAGGWNGRSNHWSSGKGKGRYSEVFRETCKAGQRKSASSVERIEKLGDGRKFWVAGADGFRFHRFERFFRRDSVEPALVRQFFVVGEIQPQQQTHPGRLRNILVVF